MNRSRMKITACLCAAAIAIGMPLAFSGCKSPSELPSGSSGAPAVSQTDTTKSSGGNAMYTSAGTAASSGTTKAGPGTQPTAGKTTGKGGGAVSLPTDLGRGTTYYVSSSTGSDSNDGKSPEKPFKTVEPVNNLSLQAGDNILFKRGDTFTGAHLAPMGSGEAADGKWITIDAYGSGANPVFKNAAKIEAAISLSALTTARAYRIRNLDIDGYLGGIVLIKSGAPLAFDGLVIENCNLRNITTNKPYGAVSAFPEKLDTAYGMYLRHIKNATIRNVTITSSDIPVRMYGVLTLFDNLTVKDSRVTGVMLFGAAESDSNLAYVESTLGGIQVQNSRILYTGSSGLHLGTTGLMIENTKGCVIKNTEVAYTTNGVGDNDGCAVDWEQLNINCTLENVYAHDNDGPFLLAMEHPENNGSSRGNRVINCLSVNNGKRNHTAEGSFLNHSGYPNVNQKILVQNCVDIGVPGSVPYTYWGAAKIPEATLNSRYVSAQGFTSGTMDVWNTFDEPGLDNFSTASGASVKDSRLSLSAGGKIRTKYAGSNYVVSTWLKGRSELVFMADGADNGYAWAFEPGKVVAQKTTGGKTVKLKDIPVSGLNPNGWFRARVEVSGGAIKTYIDDVLVDTLKDSTFTSGSAGVNASAATLVDEFFVYRYANSPRSVQTFDVQNVAPGGNLVTNSPGGWNTPETNWTPGSGIGSYIFRPYGTGHAEIVGKNAYLQAKSVNVNVSGGYNKVHVLLVNATSCPTLYIDFSTDGGKTWHTKAVTVRAMTSEKAYPFQALWPAYKDYVVDMSDVPEWGGTINGLRVRTDATSGFLNLKSVVISK